jgi:AraC-like DNA-binding protein
MDRRVQRAVAFIEDNLYRDINPNEIAQSVNLSYSRLRHVFNREFGTAPMHYLKMLRMQEAKVLLETTFLTVKEIVAKVGLKDESHFVRDFKIINGCTPAQYRQMLYLKAKENKEVETTEWALSKALS